MKILVISDTHGDLYYAEKSIKKHKNEIEFVFHLGDHDEDAKELQKKFPELRFFYVKGNNDRYSNSPEKLVVEKYNTRMVLVHGNKEKVYYGIDKLYYTALEENAEIIFFGHTHAPYYEIYENIHFCNPGSISKPRSTVNPTYGLLTINNNCIDNNLENKIYFETFEIEI